MYKSKQRKESTSDSDPGPDDRNPVKKAKKTETETDKKKCDSSSSKTSETSWSLSKNRQVNLTEFKGKWYVDIREFYLASTGEFKPGKKGLMLDMEAWQKFKSFIPEIEESIKKHV